ncbi:MAG TPA: 3-dehydroquinate synthase [Vicinamibacterales bacterium]|nr:3-dehydroquinate synthase [Vicinamibacterales bacterium]
MSATRIDVTTAAGSYPVIIGAGALDSLGQLMDEGGLGSDRVIVSSPRVWALHGARCSRLVGRRRREPVLVGDGERSKTVQTVGRVYEALITGGADRATVIVALGGGVIGDLVGFAAATYLRGVRLVHLPTTLLAQVDSAIGGKVGVNHALGKNLIGAFHPPSLVVADPLVLSTLPRREFRAGVYEVVKYGVIADPDLLDRVRARRAALFAQDPTELEAVVAASCRIKAEVVSGDERESGRRRILNFGHTIGHALEAVTEYRRFRHGEAVAYGMLAAAAIGMRRGVTPKAVGAAIAEIIIALGPLPPVSDLGISEVIAATGRDKKRVSGTLHFVAATHLGGTSELTNVSNREMRQALKDIGLRR